MESYNSEGSTEVSSVDANLLNNSYVRPVSSEFLLQGTRMASSPNYKALEESLMPVRIRLKLSGIPFSSVLQDAGFHRRLTWDIAGAVMATQMRVTVVGIEPANGSHGSNGKKSILHAHVQLEPPKGPMDRRPALELANDIIRQSSFPESSLLTAATTCATVGVEIIEVSPKEAQDQSELARLRGMVLSLGGDPTEASTQVMVAPRSNGGGENPRRTTNGNVRLSEEHKRFTVDSSSPPQGHAGRGRGRGNGLEPLDVGSGPGEDDTFSSEFEGGGRVGVSHEEFRGNVSSPTYSTRVPLTARGGGQSSAVRPSGSGMVQRSGSLKRATQFDSLAAVPEPDRHVARNESMVPKVGTLSARRSSVGSVEYTDGERRKTWFDHFLGIFTGANERKKMAALTKQEQTRTIIRIDNMQYWRIVGMSLGSFTSIVISIYTHWMWMQELDDSSYVTACKIVNILISAYMLFTLRRYQHYKNIKQRMQGREGTVNSAYFIRLGLHLFELTLLSIFPYPYVEGHNIVYASTSSLYHVETLLTMAVTCRAYNLCRLFRAEMSRKHRGASAYSMGSEALNVNSYFFWIKFALDQDAAALIGKFIFFFVVWAAYMVLLSESPYHVKRVVETITDGEELSFDDSGMAYASSNAFGDYGNCVWFVVVTMTTTGYGDITPVSPTGRGIAFVIMAVGIAVSAIITALLNDRLSLKPDESRFVNTIIHAGLVNKRKALAARVIVHFFRFVVLVRRHPEQRRRQMKLMQRFSYEVMNERHAIVRANRNKPSSKALLEDVHVEVCDRMANSFESLFERLDEMQTHMDNRLTRLENVAGLSPHKDVRSNRRRHHHSSSSSYR